MTYREAAIQVLKDEAKPLNYRVITGLAKERGYLETDAEYPEQSMNYELNSDARKGVTDGPFAALGGGVFGLREWDPPKPGPPWNSRMWRGLMDWVADERYVERRRIVSEQARQRIVALLAESALSDLTVEQFNTDVWRYGGITDAAGQPVPESEYEGWSPEEIAARFERGEWTSTGNLTVGQATNSWGTAIKDPERKTPEALRSALRTLLYASDDYFDNLDVIEKMRTGIWRNSGTLMLCMMHPDECGIWNQMSTSGMQKLAWLLGTEKAWEERTHEHKDYREFNQLLLEIRDNSGGLLEDLLSVDAFLYRLSALGEPKYWKVALAPHARFHEELVELCVQEGCAAIGFMEKPDDHSVTRFREIGPGDYVVMHTQASIGGVGRVVRPYYETGGDYVVGEISEFQRRIDVDWLVGTYDYGDALPGGKQLHTVATLDEGIFWRLAGKYSHDPRFEEVLDPPEVLPQLEPAAWVFQGNPDKWPIAEMLKRPTPFEEDWAARQGRDDMSVGDTVYIWVSGDAAGIYAVGKIISEPTEKPDSEFGPWKVDLRLDRVFDRPLLKETLKGDERTARMQVIVQPQGTNYRLTEEEASAIREMLEGAAPGPSPQAVASACCVPVAFIDEILAQLERKKQMIFYGPPGTGKTYVARKLAELLADGDRQRWELIQFHPSYTYEDFMEGIKPQSVPVGDGHCEVSYPVLAGSFMRFCKRAEKDTDKTYVFIIDEINRGQIAKIFGELMYLLEYRGEEVRLAYTKSGEDDAPEFFAIPDNVRIIGTMNTADRSIALVDFALRRRFAFYPFYPDDGGDVQGMMGRWIKRHGVADEWIGDFLRHLNEKLGQDIGRDFLVGHSYFMVCDGEGRPCLDERMLREVWRFQIQPLLDEYFVGSRGKLDSYKVDELIAQAKGTAGAAEPVEDETEQAGPAQPDGAEEQ